MTVRSDLTPQMRAYDEKFADSGEMRWLPYLMYFHPTNHVSPVVNTDASGFRYSEAKGYRYSVADHGGGPVRLLAGSSTVFGIGASADAWTLSSRLTVHDPRPEPWLNFGGRSFNSTQELILLVLYRHLLAQVKQIVLFSGFNNLGLARLPADQRLEHGAFFNCTQFFDAFARHEPGTSRRRLFRNKEARVKPEVPTMEDQLRFAVDLTLRHLAMWRAVAADLGASLTYVLQPLSGWVRAKGSQEEQALFAELDKIGRFTDFYGDILQPAICHEYARRLEAGARDLNVRFVNMAPILAETISPEQWLFVDRIHFTDYGYDFVAKQLLVTT